MRYLLTGGQMKAADTYTIETIGIPSMVLMERAALQTVACMEAEKLDFGRVLVVCGPGNNGGDGYAAARLLHLKGCHVELFFVGNENARSAENARQAAIAAHYQIPVISKLEKKEYSVVIDALFGTGLKREITGAYRDALEAVNELSGFKVAVDIPSGIHDTDGTVMGIAFRADLTVALAFEKRGLVFCGGNEYAGKIVTADIGITPEAVEQEPYLTYCFEKEDLYSGFPKRKKNSHKGSYGKLLLIAGSKGMSGAAYLSAKAAYAVGAGLVQIYTHAENRIVLQQLLPEAIVTTYEAFEPETLERLLHWADLAVIGCGLGKSETAVQLVEQAVTSSDVPCVIDADGLNILSEHMEWLERARQEIVLTPHMKEMTRLLHCEMETLLENRMEKLIWLVEQYPVVCVLKDARTLAAEKGREVYLNLSGNAAMAKGGSGDVLAGVIAGIMAQKTGGYEAARLGVYLHGLAGDCAKERKGSYSVLAGDIIDGISEVLKER